MAKHFPGLKTEEYRRMLGKFGVTGDLALQQVRIILEKYSAIIPNKLHTIRLKSQTQIPSISYSLDM